MTILDMAAMTWTCMVCGDERSDAVISVAHRPVPGFISRGSESYPAADDFPSTRFNIRYCNDRAACIEYAARPGEWTGKAPRYRVDVPCTSIDIEDLDQVERIVREISYETMWTSVSGVTRAVVLLADATPEDAIRHATAALAGRGLGVDREHIEARETRR